MFTIILILRLLNPAEAPTVVETPEAEPMRYHGLEVLLAKFEAEWDERDPQNL